MAQDRCSPRGRSVVLMTANMDHKWNETRLQRADLVICRTEKVTSRDLRRGALPRLECTGRREHEGGWLAVASRAT